MCPNSKKDPPVKITGSNIIVFCMFNGPTFIEETRA